MVRGKGILFAGVVILVAIAAGALQMWRPKPKALPPASPPKVAANEVSMTGIIEAQQVVSVAAPIPGMIESFEADIGDDVFEGSPLAHIKNTKLDAAVDAARIESEKVEARVAEIESSIVRERLEASRAAADASRAKSDCERTEKVYQRQSMLIREGATPRLVFEKAEREYQSAKEELDGKDRLAAAAQERVDSLNRELDAAKKTQQDREQLLDAAKTQAGAGVLISPVDGLVIARRGTAGEDADPSMTDFFRIAVSLGSLQVPVTPEPALVQRIKPGQPAFVRAAEVAEEIPGKVKEINNGRVVVEFQSPNSAIRPAASAHVRIPLG